MNAVDFIKKYTIDKAREVVDGAPEWASEFCFESNEYINYSDTGNVSDCNSCVPIERLKRLVESVDFINKFGGIDLAKAYDKEMGSHGFDPFFERAITNYEAIYGVNCD